MQKLSVEYSGQSWYCRPSSTVKNTVQQKRSFKPKDLLSKIEPDRENMPVRNIIILYIVRINGADVLDDGQPQAGAVFPVPGSRVLVKTGKDLGAYQAYPFSRIADR